MDLDSLLGTPATRERLYVRALDLAVQTVMSSDDEGDREECEQSLKKFGLGAWHVMNPATPFVGGWVVDCLVAHLEALYSGQIRNLIINMPPRHGKLIADDVPVLTTKGWSTHGELRPGDFVYSPNGSPTMVVAVSPPGDADHQVELTNGEIIQCHGNHEWKVYDRNSKTFRIMEAKQFVEVTRLGKVRPLWRGKRGERGGRVVYQLPKVSPLQNAEASLPVEPYTFGAWLGDGSAGKPCISHSEEKSPIIDRVKADGYNVSATCVHPSTGVVTTYFGGRPNVAGPLTSGLQQSGAYKEKHIPDAYKVASLFQRLELLAGLIDTDGSVGGDGRVRIVTGSERLADDISELVATFGWRSCKTFQEPAMSTSGIQGRLRVYTVAFQPDLDIPVAMERKRIVKFAKRRAIGVRDVRLVGAKRGKCIQVENKDGLYLVGRSLVPTHNSEWLSVMFFCWCWAKNPYLRFLYASNQDNLSHRDADRSMNIIKSPWYKNRWGSVYRLTRQSFTRIRNSAQGQRISTSIRGKGLGEGADYLIADDVHKPLEVRQANAREAVKYWWASTMHTRGNNPLTVRKIICHQRLHEDDLSGWQLSRELGYEHLCYDRTTEVLTPDGWRRFDLLEQGVPVAQVDPLDLTMTFAVPSAYTRYRYEGPMVRMQSAAFDLLVTPDHRMLYKDENDFRAGDKWLAWRVRAAKDLPRRVYIPQAARWEAKNQATVKFAGETWDGDDFCRFMGIWLAEGCTSLFKANRYRNGMYRDVVISQDVGPTHDRIAELLERIPFKFNRQPQGKKRPNHVQFKCFDQRLFDALRPFGKSGDKYVPKSIKAMATRQILLFLDWYGFGDGHRLVKNDRQTQWVSKSRRMIDDVQELLVRTGQCGGLQVHPGCFRIQNRVDKNGQKKHYGMIAPENKTVEPFADDVFCVTVPTGAILVRRNGKTAVSGNCLPARYEPQRMFVDFASAKAARVRDPIVQTCIQRERPELLDPRTELGQPLWPERFPEHALKELESEFLAIGISGQFQQRPAPSEGEIYKLAYFRYCRLQGDEVQFGQDDPDTGMKALRIKLDHLALFQTVDTAIEVNASAKYTVCLTLAIAPEYWQDGRIKRRHLIVWNVFRERLEVAEQTPALQELKVGRARWDAARKCWSMRGDQAPWPRPVILQGVERAASGYGILQQAAADGDPMIPMAASGSKVQRAVQAATLYRNGLIWHLDGMEGLADFESELLSFPSGMYSDQADCVAHAGILFNQERLLTAYFDGVPSLIAQSKRNEREAASDVVTVNGHRFHFDD